MIKFEENKDGSTTVKLDGEITVGGEVTSRITIQALKAKHLMSFPVEFNAVPTVGDWSTWASRLVTPVGAFEELSLKDGLAVALKCADLMGKSQATGESASE